MTHNFDEFIDTFDKQTQKELLDCLIIYNNTVEDSFTDTAVRVCLYTSYIDCIKATLVYNESVGVRNRNCYFYCLFLGLYALTSFFIGLSAFNLITCI